MVVRGLEVGIKPSLSACSMPLIRWLASAMQLESFLTVAEWKLLPLFCCNCTKQTNIQSNTKKLANGSVWNRRLCANYWKKMGPYCAFNIVLRAAMWQWLTSALLCFIKYVAAVTTQPNCIFSCYFTCQKSISSARICFWVWWVAAWERSAGWQQVCWLNLERALSPLVLGHRRV